MIFMTFSYMYVMYFLSHLYYSSITWSFLFPIPTVSEVPSMPVLSWVWAMANYDIASLQNAYKSILYLYTLA